MSPSLAINAVLTPKEGSSPALQAFLVGGRPLVDAEPGTLQWFAYKVDGKESYGIFDTFSNAAGRNAHADGEIPKALAANADTLLGAAPQMGLVDILGHKVTPSATGLTVGARVLLKAKAGMAAALKDALDARTRVVEADAITPFWYVFQEGVNDFGIVTVFKSAEDRTEHHLQADAQVRMGKFEDFLEGEPDVSLFTVLAYKI